MERSARVVSSVLEIDPPALIPQVRVALAELVEARVLAGDVRKDVWQYAIGLGRFEKLDVRERHLRWLVDKGYAEHALDTTRAGDHQRSFTPLPGDHLPPGACLVITDRGLALAGQAQQALCRAIGEAALKRPYWDADRRKLYYGQVMVLALSRLSRNREAALAALQEAGWPAAIEDPLPVELEDPVQRLRDTAHGLNRSRSLRIIEFVTRASGTRIGWRPCGEDSRVCLKE